MGKLRFDLFEVALFTVFVAVVTWRARLEGLAFTHKKDHVNWYAEAKKHETRPARGEDERVLRAGKAR